MHKDDIKKAQRTRQAIHSQVRLELNRTHCPTNFTSGIYVPTGKPKTQRELFCFIHPWHISRKWKSTLSDCSLSGLVVSTENLSSQSILCNT